MVVNNNFILLCTESLSMDAKSKMFGFILFISLALTALAESPPVDDSADYVKPKPPLCPKNEERRCQYPCPPQTCLTLYAAFLCIQNQTCVDGCYCKQDFLRIGPKGPCVPRDQCNPLECVNDPNAQKGCGDKCGKTCADYKTNPICPKRPCTNDGCECKEGYIYDNNLSLCVKPKDCTTPCKANERYSTCLLSECVPETCDEVGKSLACPAIAAVPCPGGCICDYGYVKDKNGNCTDAKTCPSCGGDPNAQAGCGNPCGKTCASLNVNKSELVCPQYCESNGCDCKEGYLLNTDVKPPRCVLVKDCPKPPNNCGKNEEFYCGPSCPDSEASCSNPNPPPCFKGKCDLKCFCKKGFVRDANKACIPANKCPKQCTKPHEKYSNCLLGECIPKTCDDLGKSLPCPDIAPPCAGGCICEKGYVRDKNGNCIDAKTCPPNNCGKNEEFYCGPSCPDSEASCSNPNPPPCFKGKCDLKCFCKKGFVRDANKACIPANQCPKQCTKPHEKYSNCLLGECVPKTCDDLGKPLPCPGILPPCAGGCICEEGYVRDKDGNCIDAKTCPSCGGDPNAETGCSNPCGRTCASLRTNTRDKRDTSSVACATYCKMNGCDCKKGYILNTDVNPPRCVLPEDCNKPINCTKPHEWYTNCLLGQCGPKTCEDLGKSIACPSIVGPCSGGCICEEGYLRDSEGNCIKLEQCPAKPCGENQTWISPCNAPCPNKNCPRNDKPPPACADIKPCYPGCQCKLNYLRNSTGHCILAPDCPPVNCTRKNEIWDGCPSTCLAEGCDDIDSQPKTCNTLIWLCSPRCVCKKGHFRNKDGVCVPASQCPSRQCTKPNEKYIDCLPGQCKPKTCDELVTPAPCPKVLPPCPGGCICVDGYVRNKAGDCIKQEDCPKQCKGTHEKYIDCPAAQCNLKTCDDLVTSPGCPIIKPPCPGGCVCEEGYLRNSKGICIKQEQCPSRQCTKPNEKYTDCLPGQCKPKTCDELVTPAPCPKVVPPCPGGCICVDGYVRNKAGDCIKQEDCPKNCTRPNEMYTDCVNDQCYPRTCKDVVKMESCPTTKPGTCRGGCICKRGFVRSDNGTCIAIKDCPEAGTCTDPNQAWTDCAANCANAFCPPNDQPQPICFLPVGACQPGCKCKPNYRIDKNNNCIPARDCPEVPCTRVNEEYDSCPGNRITSCALLATVGTTPVSKTGAKICNPGCICKQGFYQNANGTCVPKCECTSDSSDSAPST